MQSSEARHILSKMRDSPYPTWNMDQMMIFSSVDAQDDDQRLLLATSIAAAAFVGLASFPGLFAIVLQLRNRTPKDNFYEDEDGTSTPEAIAAFSNKIPKIFTILLSLIALGVSIGISVLSSLDATYHDLFLENWLLTGASALILLQVICLSAHHAPVTSYNLGVWAMLSAAATLAASIFQTRSFAEDLETYRDVSLSLRLTNAFVLVLLMIACVSLPRRPDVFFNGRIVDSQRTTTMLSRMTFSWAFPLLSFAKKKGDLDEADVPGPDHVLRAQNLLAAWHDAGFEGKLSRFLIRVYMPRLALQWSVVVIRTFVGVGPFWALLRLLQILEESAPGERPVFQLLSINLALGALNLTGQWMESWLFSYSHFDIAYPLRAQLSTIVYEKAMRRKNVKMADKNSDIEGEQKDEQKDDLSSAKKDDKKPDDSRSVLKSRQAIVNLVGVDTRHISSFAAFQYIIPGSILRLIFYCGFLISLIGWIPFACGIATWFILLPINTMSTKAYFKLDEKVMKMRDTKLAVINEALLGMRQIKFSAMEKQWEKRILGIREKEISILKKIFVCHTTFFALWVTSPILLAAVSLAVYATMNGILTPSVAFVSISVFKSLELTLSVLPEIFSEVIDCLVSLRRIETYLNGPELPKVTSDGPDIAFDNAVVSWPVDEEVPEEERFVLKNLNLSFPSGELSVISGKTGTGKSLLLSAILGEVDLLEGSILTPPTVAAVDRNDNKAHAGNWIIPGSIAYVGQTPWLESASLRDNILYGLPFVESRYDTVLETCALKKDIEMLTDGDRTELGANGVNLSGGQKWRVTLARAIYSRAEILVMDDIFSAVDAHVGRQIFEKCIAGEICQKRTRILVTHHVALVQSKAKYLVELGEGSVLNAGLTSDLAEDGTLERIKSHEQTRDEILADGAAESSPSLVTEETLLEETADGTSATETGSEPAKQDKKDKDAKEFVQKETRDKGQVKRHVYMSYIKHSGGWIFWVILTLMFVSFQVGDLARNWWVNVWTRSFQTKASGLYTTATFQEPRPGFVNTFTLNYRPHGGSNSSLDIQSASHGLSYYLTIYVSISLACAVAGTVRFAWSFMMSIMASRILFEKILFAVLRTPLRWIDTVPVGRILNRMTSDFEVIDNRLNMDMGMFLWRSLGLVGICVAATFVSPAILPVSLTLITVGGIIALYFLAGARPTKRLESTAKSPVFEQFNATLSGIATVRAYQKTQAYIDRMNSSLDMWDSVSYYNILFARWMSFRMFMIGTLFTATVGMIISLSQNIDASMAGFTLSFSLEFAANILLTIWSYSSMELDMNAAERVLEYAELKTEPLDGEKPAAAWPTTGDIDVKNLVVSYAEDLPPVLKGISFNVKNNERIGVVGRTGAGKSSLTLALFRFLEPRSGQVFIDGLDISKLNLEDLRSRLTIIPQDPVLFSGTIRSNLDPFDDLSDEQLKESLRRVHLVDSLPATPANEPSSSAASTVIPGNVNIFQDLSSGIAESGGNLSQGQRQLLCMARAIVSRPKIMVLDEATSAVDMTTDSLIQRSIREEFTDCTLIVIAHRLSTIADFDRILVLSDGEVAEFGTPKELWHKEDGVFRNMCESSGEKDKLMETVLGK